MSSASFDRPSTKLILSAIGIVVLLHVLTAIALTLVKTPTPVIEPLQETPPIEIELLTIADTTSSESDSDSNNDGEANNAEVIDAEEATIEEAQAEPEAQIEPEAELEVEPQVEPEPEIEQEPIVEVERQPAPELVAPKPEITEPEPEVIPPEPETIEPEAQVESAQPPATEPELKSGVITSTTTTIKSSSDNSGASNASPSTSAPAAETYGGGYTPHSTIPTAPTVSSMPQANRDGKSQRPIPKGRDEAPKKDAIATPPATNNEPITYGNINDSSWQTSPNFNSIQNNKYNFKTPELSIEVSFSVDVYGNISNIKIIKNSGSNRFGKDFINALSKAKLKPTTIDEKPVKSVANFKFRMKQQ
ncbi:energy transducer TonB [Psychrobacter jeotgali]|uniref:energy transducer TonB n=1 Tax=Psychrobacter jeotgali TaxID=179010 RepID=UPI00191A9F59|nr:energy transducer TonB [Psychrobacter jeotgali]